MIGGQSASKNGRCNFNSSTTNMPVSAMLDPTERSIPPEMMMSVIPIAAVPTTAVCASMIRRFSSVAKRS